MNWSRATVLALALLIALAFFLHRSTQEKRPQRAPSRVPVVEPAGPGERGSANASKPAASPAALAVEAAASAGPPGTIRGLVRIKAPVPPRRFVRLDVDPKCESFHAGPLLSDEIVADANGNVQWAFVYVKSGLVGTPPPAPAAPVLMDQIRCIFTPHVVGLRVGQRLNVLNSDATLHNVHALPFDNKEFNMGLPTAGTDLTRTFDRPEVMIKIKCDIHPWMTSWIGVLDHPYFSITNPLGSYAIPELPPGKYVVEAWHEGYAPVTASVGLAPGGDVRLDFLLDARRD
jgi:plastocyanin